MIRYWIEYYVSGRRFERTVDLCEGDRLAGIAPVFALSLDLEREEPVHAAFPIESPRIMKSECLEEGAVA